MSSYRAKLWRKWQKRSLVAYGENLRLPSLDFAPNCGITASDAGGLVKPIDSKREEFRKYLEKAGAMDALTKVLVMLYDEPEKPADALDYIRKHLGDTRPDEKEIEIMKADLEASTIKIQTLEDEIKVLKEKLQQYEPQEDKIPMDEENIPADTPEEPPSSTSPIDAVTTDQPRTGTVESIPPTE